MRKMIGLNEDRIKEGKEKRDKGRRSGRGEKYREGGESYDVSSIWITLPSCFPPSPSPGERCLHCYSSSWHTLQGPSLRPGFSSKCVLSPTWPRTSSVCLKGRQELANKKVQVVNTHEIKPGRIVSRLLEIFRGRLKGNKERTLSRLPGEVTRQNG